MRTTQIENAARRRFIIDTSVIGGGLMLGLGTIPTEALAQKNPAYNHNTIRNAADPEVNAWVNIKPDETVVIRIARSEMGQGTRTGLAQMVSQNLQLQDKVLLVNEHGVK
jgi:isoquinoline 1-oxidoreductase beta subunit